MIGYGKSIADQMKFHSLVKVLKKLDETHGRDPEGLAVEFRRLVADLDGLGPIEDVGAVIEWTAERVGG